MKIGKLEFGIVTYENKLTRLELFSYTKGLCECYIFSFYKFYITWLSNYCYKSNKDV